MNEPLILKTLKGEKTEQIPFWFMRQAGRYLPEYREMRKDYSNFLDFCYTPDAATEVTLQPLRRFDMDAAILFSDILVIPDGLGQEVKFVKGEGPKLGSLNIPQLSQSKLIPHLQPVFTAIKHIRSALTDDKALIGFSGAPWTLACYMIEGQGSREFQMARQYAASEPEAFAQLMDLLCESIIEYGCAQIEAGIDVFQLFDSWAGVVPAAQFDAFVIKPTKCIVAGIKAKYPNTPIIGFAKGAGANLAAYAAQTGVDALGIDQQMPLLKAKEMRANCVLQGNLDNVTLASSKQASLAATKQILEQWSDIPFIFNLGHGFLPHTPIEHVEAVVETIKGFKRHV
jgi:uroporphyrinogen decarboxylase